MAEEVTIKLGRHYDDIFLADTKGNILVRSISEADYLYLIKYLENKVINMSDEACPICLQNYLYGKPNDREYEELGILTDRKKGVKHGK